MHASVSCRAALAVASVVGVPRRSEPRHRHGVLSQRARVKTRASPPSDDGPNEDGDEASSSESLFTPEFSAAFREAQERLDAKAAASPDRQRIDKEVKEIIQRVETERELEVLLPVEVEDDERKDVNDVDSSNNKKQEIEEEFGEKLDNPLFTPEFKKHFIEAQERLAEKRAPMMAKINDEVAEIMKQVNKEREAAARGEVVDTSKPLRASGSDNANLPEVNINEVDDALGSLFGGGQAFRESMQQASALPSTPSSPSTSSYGQLPSPDAGVLGEMKIASHQQLENLRNSLMAIEQAVLNEQMQLQRIDFALDKARREARYAEADRVAKERREQEDGR